MCAVGILLALIDRGNTGHGQVVNTDMVIHHPTFIFYIHIVVRYREHVMSLLLLSFLTIFRHHYQGGQIFWMAAHLFTMFTVVKTGAGCQSDA